MAKKLALVGKIGPAFDNRDGLSLMEIQAHGSVVISYETGDMDSAEYCMDLLFRVMAENIDSYWEGLADPALRPILAVDWH